MTTNALSRRAFLAASATPLLAANDWISLFNGRSLDGWRPSENKDSWKVVDGQLHADGPRSHLFYNGANASFRNFELELEAMASPNANSGVYFHTRYQETGYPNKGFEVQVNNTAGGEGSYRERKKTGSLYGLRNVYKQLVEDNQWFKLNVLVRGKNIQVRVNGMHVVDYTEPTPPVIPDGMEKERFLDRGTIALQCHDPASKARYRSIRIRPLPDDATAGEPPVVDDTFRRIIHTGRHNVPMVDYHVHLKSGFTLEQALAKSRRDGIQYGLAVNCGKGFPVQDDASARAFLESIKGQPVFIAMQAEGREWTSMFSRGTVALFDYVFTDSMTWTDNNGRRMRLWIPDEVGTISDEQAFMDLLVERTVGILNREPIDIYVNPTFIPASISARYDALWTETRMQKVVEAAARNGVAIELNDRYKLPGAAFVRMAKAAKCKFSFGTNNGSAADLGRSEYGLRMLEECKLTWQDFFVPGVFQPKAALRKGDVLKAG
ncbi:MAG: DUF1080 domain-containing protein [Acidobacteria bacterium]|nr:DUF1080 domain-containing protein [Acidobacteriota bacterium]